MRKIVLSLIFVMTVVNLVAVLGPEIGFDALWYQLTLPKLWLLKHQWYFSGGLLYYSPMPRLGGVLFMPFLNIWGESGAKVVQFIFGLASAWVTYKIARIKFDSELSTFAAACFYITNIVSWQSGSGYVDLIRTFFEISAFYFAISDTDSGWLSIRKILSGILIGLAVGTKWQAIVTLLMLSVWFSPVIFVVGIMVAAPWMIIAYQYTHNPLFPVFETFMSQIQLREVGPHFFDLSQIFRRIISVPWQFVRPYDDHTNPALFLVMILGLTLWKLMGDKYARTLIAFGLGGLVIWQIIPPPSTRYYLPYLPYLAIFAAFVLKKYQWMKYLMIVSFVIVIFMRIKADLKYLPYLTGRESKEEFLDKSITDRNTFVDVGGEIKNRMPSDKRYLIDGLANLYYFPFDFDHTSWVDDYQNYDYLVTNREPIWKNSQLILENSRGIRIYKKALE